MPGLYLLFLTFSPFACRGAPGLCLFFSSLSHFLFYVVCVYACMCVSTCGGSRLILGTVLHLPYSLTQGISQSSWQWPVLIASSFWVALSLPSVDGHTYQAFVAFAGFECGNCNNWQSATSPDPFKIFKHIETM